MKKFMKVCLLSSLDNQNLLDIIYAACRQCYSSDSVGDHFPYINVSNEEKEKLIQHVIKSGHHSTIEHVSFTFAISGITRAIAQQLTRHRLASFSMQSQRYCDSSNSMIRIPEVLDKSTTIYKKFSELTDECVNFYKYMVNECDIPTEDARSILPINVLTNIVVTMNCRELIHFFSERLCKTAQKEIRDLAKMMLEICQKKLPAVFKSIGPKCHQLGYCPESKKRSCGRKPLKDDVFEVYYKNIKKEL